MVVPVLIVGCWSQRNPRGSVLRGMISPLKTLSAPLVRALIQSRFTAHFGRYRQTKHPIIVTRQARRVMQSSLRRDGTTKASLSAFLALPMSQGRRLRPAPPAYGRARPQAIETCLESSRRMVKLGSCTPTPPEATAWLVPYKVLSRGVGTVGL